MNLQEACQELHKSETTLTTAFKRTKDNLEKNGIILTKIGQGKKAEYYIEYLENAKPITIKNQRFGKLIALEETDKRVNGYIMWKCICDCGNECIVSSANLKRGATKSCGCLIKESATKTAKELGHKNLIDITGQKFFNLKVINRVGSDKRGESIWKCQCDCGNITNVLASNLKSGNTKSCGCIKSFGEQTIIKILKENNIDFIYQYKADSCKFLDSGYNAIFDFYVNNTYIIEYDGEQHFKQGTGIYNNEKKFKQIKEKDEFKNQWCKDNNIPLIRIPYTHLNKLCIEDLLLETSQFIIY